MNGQGKENAVIEDNETLDFEDFDLDSLENQLEEELESQLSDLEFIKSEKEKIGNPDALGKVVMDEVWKRFTNQIGLEVTNETLIQKYDREGIQKHMKKLVKLLCKIKSIKTPTKL